MLAGGVLKSPASSPRGGFAAVARATALPLSRSALPYPNGHPRACGDPVFQRADVQLQNALKYGVARSGRAMTTCV
jgi:hypothetical protein